MNKKSLLQLSFALIITFILIIPTNMFVIAQVFPGDAINSPPIAHDQTISINEDSVVITLTGSDADGDALTFSIINAPSDGALSKISRLDPTSAELTYKPNLGLVSITSGECYDLSTATIVGGEGDDVLTGTPGHDIIYGRGGHDIICGGSGNDILFGGSGDDKIYGGEGNDTAYADSGDDKVFGGGGLDVIYGGGGTDTLHGGLDDDHLYGNEGSDKLMGSLGNDFLSGGDGDDVIFGGEGNDNLLGGTGNDRMDGGPGNNEMALNGADTFTFQVNDGSEDSNTARVEIAAGVEISVDAMNEPPVADAGIDQTVNENTLLAMDGTSSFDPDGDTLTYSWRQTCGPNVTVTDPSSANPTFITPSIRVQTALIFQLIVNDGIVDSTADNVTITVSDSRTRLRQRAHSSTACVNITVDASNYYPVADDLSISTEEDTLVVFTLTGSDPDGDALTFHVGSPSNGVLSGTAPNLTYTPNPNFNGVDSFSFKVNDSTEDSNTARVEITIGAVNDPPVAHAGRQQTANEGTIVTLDGTASSDLDEDPLTYSWVQTSGPIVTLNNPPPSTPTFIAPSVDARTVLTFQLTVNDGKGGSALDNVDVTVEDIPVDDVTVQTSVWQKTYGGVRGDSASTIQPTSDGGYVLAGRTRSFSATGDNDIYVVKVDRDGSLQWSRAYGGSAEEWTQRESIEETSDGGYILSSYTKSFGVAQNDFYILKLDSSGDVEWSRTYGGTGEEWLYAVKEAQDGGYIMLGWTSSSELDNVVGRDFLIVKLSTNGDFLWSKTYGGTRIGADEAYSLQRTTDGGYVMMGFTQSFGNGGGDAYVVKIDAGGNLQWSKAYGGPGVEMPKGLEQTSDGGYIVGGRTNTKTGGSYDFYALKIDANGDVQWANAYGAAGWDGGWSVDQTADGGYVVVGWTTPTIDQALVNDIFVLKINPDGSLQWSKKIGGDRDDRATDVLGLSDGSVLVVGRTMLPTNAGGMGGDDVVVIKIDSLGNTCSGSDFPVTVNDQTDVVPSYATTAVSVVTAQPELPYFRTITSNDTRIADATSKTVCEETTEGEEVSPFNFSISATPVSGFVTQGGSASIPVTTTLVSGTTETVDFSASGLPSGATASFSPVRCDPDCSATLTIHTSSATPPGTYTISISASSKEVTRTTSYTLIINTPPAEATACEDLGIIDIRAIGNDGNIPTNTIDNDLGTRWSNDGKGSWIVYDLGGQRDLCNVDIAWYTGDRRTNSFVISASSDGSTYTDIYTGSSSGTTLLPEKYDLADVNARYVRITVNGNTQNDWASITEVDIYGDSTTSTGNDDDNNNNNNNNDTIPPTIIAPDDITAEGNGPLTHIPLGTPYISDNVDPSPSVTNNAPGDGFPRGSSIVTWRVTDDSGNSATDTQSITIVDTPAVDSTSTLDRFGIRDMYPTVSSGREWFSNWDNGVSRTVNSGQRDPYNSELIARGNGRVEIDGNGIARLSGTQPRMYVYDAPQLKKWDDIELTFYGRRVSESGTSSSAGFMAGMGDHQNQNLGDCNVNTYYAGMRYDGRMLFIKEIDHYDTGNSPAARPWSGVPRNEWVGFKAIIRTVGPDSVNLQLYRDMTNGLNGGTWEKMVEYTDSGGWSVGAKCHGGSSNEVLTGASGSVFIRNTSVSNAEYKWFSVREI